MTPSEEATGLSLLDEPAIVAARRVAVTLSERAAARWRELATAGAAERGTGGTASEALHDFRVALRSLRSWLRAYDDVIELPQRTRRRLRAAANATSAARDAEVLAVRLAWMPLASRRAVTASRWWSRRLAAEALDPRIVDRSRRDVERALAAVCETASIVRFARPLTSRWELPTLAADLAPRLRAQATVVRRRLAAIDGPDAAEREHRARLAAKHLRYLLEPIESELPAARNARVLLKSLQDALGDLHDLRVASSTLPDAINARAADEAERRGREALEAANEQRTMRRIDSLLPGFAALSTALETSTHDAFRTLEKRWLAEGADELCAAIDAVADALEARNPNHVEIERKLLLRAAPTPPADAVASVTVIDQGYLPGKNVIERVRRTERDGKLRFTRTVKSGQGLVRTEIDDSIDAALFDRLWPLTDGRRVRKRRTVVVDEQQRRWEIDVFLDRELVLAEIELKHPDDDTTPPAWLATEVTRDVTDDVEYTNSRLAH